MTQRRWLAACNPGLAKLITQHIGPGWVTDLDLLENLKPLADNADFQASWHQVKQNNKARLASNIKEKTGIVVDNDIYIRCSG